MNAAVSVRWAIVQNERFFTCFSFANSTVQILFVPVFQHFRLTFSQIATHRKRGFRQVQSMFIVAHQS